MSPFSRKRREPRFRVEGVRGTLQRPGDLRIINVSRRGLAFATLHSVTVGRPCFMEVRYRGQVVDLELDVRWCFRPPDLDPDDAPVYIAGGRFVDIFRDDPEGLWRGLVTDEG